jgi:hypothetical protein
LTTTQLFLWKNDFSVCEYSKTCPFKKKVFLYSKKKKKMPSFKVRLCTIKGIARNGSSYGPIYVELECNRLVYRTEIHNGSALVDFDKPFQFNVGALDPLKIVVWEEGTCCTGDIQLANMSIDIAKGNLVQGVVSDQWYTFPRTPDTEVHLRILPRDFGLPHPSTQQWHQGQMQVQQMYFPAPGHQQQQQPLLPPQQQSFHNNNNASFNSMSNSNSQPNFNMTGSFAPGSFAVANNFVPQPPPPPQQLQMQMPHSMPLPPVVPPPGYINPYQNNQTGYGNPYGNAPPPSVAYGVPNFAVSA